MAITDRRNLEQLVATPTISVEEASRWLGISRTAAYQAVQAGEIPALRVGRRYRVITRKLFQMLGGEDILDADRSEPGPERPELVGSSTHS